MEFNIKKLRQERGFTQTEMADKLKMTLGNYQKYEYGRIRTYPHNVIASFCRVLNCTPNDLFQLTDEDIAA